jgi:hypothetical protein
VRRSGTLSLISVCESVSVLCKGTMSVRATRGEANRCVGENTTGTVPEYQFLDLRVGRRSKHLSAVATGPRGNYTSSCMCLTPCEPLFRTFQAQIGDTCEQATPSKHHGSRRAHFINIAASKPWFHNTQALPYSLARSHLKTRKNSAPKTFFKVWGHLCGRCHILGCNTPGGRPHHTTKPHSDPIDTVTSFREPLRSRNMFRLLRHRAKLAHATAKRYGKTKGIAVIMHEAAVPLRAPALLRWGFGVRNLRVSGTPSK